MGLKHFVPQFYSAEYGIIKEIQQNDEFNEEDEFDEDDIESLNVPSIGSSILESNHSSTVDSGIGSANSQDLESDFSDTDMIGHDPAPTVDGKRTPLVVTNHSDDEEEEVVYNRNVEGATGDDDPEITPSKSAKVVHDDEDDTQFIGASPIMWYGSDPDDYDDCDDYYSNQLDIAQQAYEDAIYRAEMAALDEVIHQEYIESRRWCENSDDEREADEEEARLADESTTNVIDTETPPQDDLEFTYVFPPSV
nr:hypothetical protein [Abalone asfa-like virus]